MIQGIETVGEVVTGGMIARSIEPRAGEASGHAGKCLNCGTSLNGDFCHRCGQQGHVHRTLGAFWHDVSHSVLHFEGKIWRTLPLLAWRPGELTRRYSQGERARFVSPMALFLFSVFIMFAVFNSIGDRAFADRRPAKTLVQEEAEFRAERAVDLAELQAERAERARLVAAGEPTTSADVDIRILEQEIALEERLHKEEIARERAQAQREAEQRKAGRDPDAAVDMNLNDAPPAIRWLDEPYRRAKKNPSLLIYKLQSNAYKFSWALILISVPLVALLFLHRRRYRQYRLYDHTVFVTYSIAFMSIAAVVLTLLKLAGLNGPAALLPLAVPPIHMYRQLRGAYLLSRWSAGWRTIMMVLFAFVAGGLFMLLLLMMGVLG